MKKLLFISSALFVSLMLVFPASAVTNSGEASSSPAGAGSSATNTPMLINYEIPPATSTATLPDFEITEVTAKAPTSEASTKNYYVTVINHGGAFVLSADNALGLSFRNDLNVNSTENASYYSVGTAGDTFAKDQKMTVGPLLVAVDGVHMIKIMINPLFTVAESKYNNNYFQKEVRVGLPEISTNTPPIATSTPPVTPKATSTESTKPKATSTPPVVKPSVDLKKEAALLIPSGTSTDKLNTLLKELKLTKNTQAMTTNMTSFVDGLKKQYPKEAVAKFYTINNFVTYGTASTLKLSAEDRFSLVAKFIVTNRKLPSTEADWSGILGMKK
ncbi:MAG: hypothetical protein NT165_02790 [Candidatus Falkowbacteria bacterium]|nr:hypothetical protein [Candidatus Falkowbacteria bacterium]